jgi:hypothetical protein
MKSVKSLMLSQESPMPWNNATGVAVYVDTEESSSRISVKDNAIVVKGLCCMCCFALTRSVNVIISKLILNRPN